MASSFQSSEFRDGKPTPGTIGGGRSLRGDTGVGSTFTSSASSCESPSVIEAIDPVMNLEPESASGGPRRHSLGGLTLILMIGCSPTAGTRP